MIPRKLITSYDADYKWFVPQWQKVIDAEIEKSLILYIVRIKKNRHVQDAITEARYQVLSSCSAENPLNIFQHSTPHPTNSRPHQLCNSPTPQSATHQLRTPKSPHFLSLQNQYTPKNHS